LKNWQTTYAEAQQVCSQQHGTLKEENPLQVCYVEDFYIFAFVAIDGRVTRLAVYYRGGDAIGMREQTAELWGPHDEESINDHGFRRWTWHRAFGRFVVEGCPWGAGIIQINETSRPK
jgi:hypothetical protein